MALPGQPHQIKTTRPRDHRRVTEREFDVRIKSAECLRKSRNGQNVFGNACGIPANANRISVGLAGRPANNTDSLGLFAGHPANNKDSFDLFAGHPANNKDSRGLFAGYPANNKDSLGLFAGRPASIPKNVLAARVL